MDIGTYLRQATDKLQQVDILTARLDVLILLEDLLDKDRSLILAHTDDLLTQSQKTTLDALIERRMSHEPLAYIRGHAAFYGRDFAITKDVLVPRPETEAMIEMIKALDIPSGWTLADIGTGSGAIGITVALETALTQVDLYDISPQALAVAQRNIDTLSPQTPVNLYSGNLLTDLHHNYDILATNLPYVPTDFPINKAAQHEPGLALFSGDDGLRDYRAFWEQVADLKYKPTYITTESIPSQHAALAIMAKVAGFTLRKTDDFIQLFSKD